MSDKRELTLKEFLNGYNELCNAHKACSECPLAAVECFMQIRCCDIETIIEEVTKFLEKKNAPKPVETEWVDARRIYRVAEDGSWVFCKEIGEDSAKDTETLLTEYVKEQTNGKYVGEYVVKLESYCRIKK